MKKKKRGVTLIELVVVVAIVAMLSFIIYSKITRTIAKSRDAQALSSVAALRKASLLYFTEQEKSFSAIEDDGEITETDMRNLVSNGYLESKAMKSFLKNGETTASIEVGNAGDAESCKIIAEAKYVPLKLHENGVDIIFEAGTYDSSCIEWSTK